MKDLKQKAVSILKEYYEKTEQVECTDGIESSLIGFLGYDPNEYDLLYEMASIRALAAFTDPKISTALIESMGPGSYKILIEMLTRLQSFTSDLQMDHYRAYTEALRLDIYGLDTDNEHERTKTLQGIIDETEKNLAALRVRHPDVKL
jgi:hypothetical protein